jgi:hypothetical protein
VDIDYACTDPYACGKHGCGYNNTATPTANLSSVGCTGGTVAPRARGFSKPHRTGPKTNGSVSIRRQPLTLCSHRYSTGVIFTNVVIKASREFNISIDAVSAAFLVFFNIYFGRDSFTRPVTKHSGQKILRVVPGSQHDDQSVILAKHHPTAL